MKKLFALTFIILLSGCGKWTSLHQGEGGTLAPSVNLLVVNQKQVTIKGLRLDQVKSLKFVDPN